MATQPNTITPELKLLREKTYHQQRTRTLKPLLQAIGRTAFEGSDVWLADPDNPRERKLIDHVVDACLFHGIKEIPQVVVVKTPLANAASAAGGGFLFTTGILDHMNETELRAVVGHELSHHRHRGSDIGMMFGLVALMELGTRKLNIHPVQWFSRNMEHASRFKHYTIEAMALITSNIMAAWAINPYRWKMELKSDRDGAAFESPQSMGGALEVLHRENHALNDKQWQESSPLKKCAIMLNRAIGFLFYPLGSHPPTQVRIRIMRHLEAAAESKNSSGASLYPLTPATRIQSADLTAERVEDKDTRAIAGG